MGVLIVRRGLSDRYHQLLRIFANARGLEVVVDRRVGDRRHQQAPVSEERRRRERRREPPRTWAEADFVILTPPADE